MPKASRLIVRLRPMEMERLDGYLGRLRRSNYYTDVTWYRCFLGGSHVAPNILSADRHFEALSTLSGLDPQQLRSMTLHRFVPYYQPPHLGRRLGSRLLREQSTDESADLPSRGRSQYVRMGAAAPLCPLCVAQRRTLFLPWLLRHVTTCAVHKVLLVSRCPGCGRGLRLDRDLCACYYCALPLGSFPTLFIAEHEPSMVLTALIQYGVGAASEIEPHLAGMLGPLAAMAPGMVLRFFWRFAVLIAEGDPGNAIFARENLLSGTDWEGPPADPWLADVVDVHGVLAGVCRLLLDWPHSWHSTLERLAAVEVSRGLRRRVPQVLSQAFPEPEWDWLRESWADYVGAHMHHMPVLQPWLHYYRQMMRQQGQASEVLSPKQAAKELGVKVETFKALMDSGLIEVTPPPLPPPPTPLALLMPEGPLSTHKKPERSYRIAIISIDSVRKLSATRRSQLSLLELASRLGVHHTVARSLISAGLLQVSRGTYGHGRAITTGEVNRFLESVCGSAQVRSVPQGQPGVLNLRGAWDAGSYYLVHLPELLRAVQDGTLPAYREDESFDLHRLWFYKSDVQAYLGRVETPDGRVLLARTEVMKVLRCSLRTLRRLAERGLLFPVVRDPNRPTALWRYDSRDVEEFLTRYITCEEAASILGCTRDSLDELARLGRLPHKLVAYVGRFTPDDVAAEAGQGRASKRKVARRYDREVLSDWVQDRLTSAEAAELLGVPQERVRAWARKGLLSRVSSTWFSRRELLEWRDNWLSARQVAQLFDVDPSTIARWARLGKLTPVVGVGTTGKWRYFSRRDIESILSEWITIEEAASLLGVHRSTIEGWCKTGKLVPLGRGIKGRIWLDRTAIIEMVEQVQLKCA